MDTCPACNSTDVAHTDTGKRYCLDCDLVYTDRWNRNDPWLQKRLAEVDHHLLTTDPRKLSPAGRLLRKAALRERGIRELRET